MLINDGQVLNPSFLECRLATAVDMPKIETVTVENYDDNGPFGAKGAGNSSVINLAAAISNAVCNAVGVRIKELPISPAKVLQGLKKRRPEMQLPQFEYVESKSLEDAACFLQEKGRQSMLIGGGTDMLPSMKQRIYHPTYIISLAALPDLKQIQCDDDGGSVKLGAALKLCTLENNDAIKKRFPIVAQAARAVGSPQLREMGTLGKNLCLDTRCYYYNQSETWRKCRPACIKMDGDVCNATGSGKKCFAVFSGDMAPSLIDVDARIILHSARGERTISAG